MPSDLDEQVVERIKPHLYGCEKIEDVHDLIYDEIMAVYKMNFDKTK